MNHTHTVIQFIIVRKPKAERICAGKNNFHTHHRIDIRKKCGGINKVFHKGDFINKGVTIAVIKHFV